MKLKLVVGLLMIAAMSIGFFIGRLHAGGDAGSGHTDPKLSEVVAQMVESMESSSRVEAARDVRAIEFIESGETSKAVQLLCHPIAEHYHLYAINAVTERRRRLLRRSSSLPARIRSWRMS